MPVQATSALLAALYLFQQPVVTPTAPPLTTNAVIAALESKAGLRYDDMFPRKPNFGHSAQGPEWSKDGRYLAYIWAPYDWKGGSDLYVYDTQSHDTIRCTSPKLMGRYNRDVAKAMERYKTDAADDLKMLDMNDLQWREWKLKKKEEDEKRKEPLPAYPAVGEMEWSPKGDELLFTWGGDVYRTSLAQRMPVRLTRTKEAERSLHWLPDASGYAFVRGSGVFRVLFNSGSIEQLNPELPTGINFTGYRLSPDGTKLMVTASKPGPPERQIDYISYRERFAQAKKMNRAVADDPFSGESYVYLYDTSQDSMDEVKGDGKPWEVWKWPGGKGWQEISVNEEPWSADSKKFTFASWKRDERDLEVMVADTEKKEVKAIFKTKPDGEHTTPGICDPFFTQDGSGVICLLDTTGYRHPWKLDAVSGAATELVKGDYEMYPMKETKDGKWLFIHGQKEDAAMDDVYRLDMSSGNLDRVTHRAGTYGNVALTEDGSKFGASFANWDSPNEYYVVDGSKEDKITDSHKPNGFAKINVLKPTLFTYKNRLGMDVHGYMFLPPGWKKTDKRPLMIYVYGGPLGTTKQVQVGTFNSTGYLLNMYLAKVFGYVAVTIDPRGDTGYGAAFGKANYQQPGKAQVEDLTDGVKYLIANYGVDPDKVGINGWSFGGFQTQMCMYTAPDVFKLGIAGAGPTEWQNYNNWYSQGTIGPVPNSKPDDLDKYSLTYLAKNLQGPLFLLHGMEDDNVMFQDTIKVYRKLMQYGRGPLVELAVDPTGTHGLGGDIDNRDRLALFVGFVNKWWGPYNKVK